MGLVVFFYCFYANILYLWNNPVRGKISLDIKCQFVKSPVGTKYNKGLVVYAEFLSGNNEKNEI